MKYVELLSGGKDSCYNLLHCHRNGHELVAAASLGPEQGKGLHGDLPFQVWPNLIDTQRRSIHTYTRL